MNDSIEIRFDKNPILLLEDSKHEVLLLKHTLKDLEVNNELIVADNGEEGLKYLSDRSNTLPGIILLDINMPKMNGFEFLKVVKKNPVFRCIPVIVLTSSNRKEDRFEAFSLGVSGYMTKPLDLNRYRQIISSLVKYWNFNEWYSIPGDLLEATERNQSN
jgi:CheY-like chemotaxis protein